VLVIAPAGGPSIGVDLTQVPQDQHAQLREGDRVVVTGTVASDGSRVVAYGLERGPGVPEPARR
jgi:hypothetical protein